MSWGKGKALLSTSRLNAVALWPSKTGRISPLGITIITNKVRPSDLSTSVNILYSEKFNIRVPLRFFFYLACLLKIWNRCPRVLIYSSGCFEEELGTRRIFCTFILLFYPVFQSHRFKRFKRYRFWTNFKVEINHSCKRFYLTFFFKMFVSRRYNKYS